MIRCTLPLSLLIALMITWSADARAAGRLPAVRTARASARVDAAAASLVTAEPLPPAETISPLACSPAPCLIYRHHGHHRAACCGCAPPIQMVLSATDPCTCCPVEIPVCVPGCCADVPSVCCRRGLFGASIQEFNWACGYSVTVRFKHNGQVLVVSRG